MKNKDFSQLLLQITEMDHRQRSSLLNALAHLSDDTQVIECIESKFDADGKCPFCSRDITLDIKECNDLDGNFQLIPV